MKFVWSVIWIIVGILIMRYNFQIVSLFGKIDWAERKLGGGLGGTYVMYKLIGLFIVIFALLYLFDATGFIVSPLSGVFGGNQE